MNGADDSDMMETGAPPFPASAFTNAHY